MRNRPAVLTWIIAFKAVKTTILTAVGVGVLTVRHADPVDVLLRLALAFHLPLTSRLLNRLLSSVSNLTLPKETALAMTAFAYAILMGSEGVSLYLRKPWARWFTIIATSSLIPIELYEIAREMHPIRVLVLLANVAIVVYLCRRGDVFESQARRTPLVQKVERIGPHVFMLQRKIGAYDPRVSAHPRFVRARRVFDA